MEDRRDDRKRSSGVRRLGHIHVEIRFGVIVGRDNAGLRLSRGESGRRDHITVNTGCSELRTVKGDRDRLFILAVTSSTVKSNGGCTESRAAVRTRINGRRSGSMNRPLSSRQ